ncbi:sensor histidine kinase [Spirosoma sp. KNUC1025]|uniref:sensor histidine kinase n=1 Tax=Spirosoma sp. KNUC1025 TaxID=2894082 RepID=UPI003868CBDF|nr:histidine kinase [Spirosoma sp. KNUC1025]
MGYETWLVLFLGMMTALLLYNVVQWSLYRERIYGLYTVYLLVWLAYFPLRSFSDFPDNAAHFIRITGPMLAYFVYYDFTIAFLNLRTYRPGLLRLFRGVQTGLIAYLLLEVGFCFITDYWRLPVHELIHTGVRLSLAVLSGYIIGTIYQRKDPVRRLFITGSALLVLGALTAMILTMTLPLDGPAYFWLVPLTYLQIGIVLELIFFSVGLAYRHRRDLLKKTLFEQALTRERKQRQRDYTEARQVVELLQQEVDEMHMRALQAQISPHFLFNSLNSLSALIADEPPKAEQFVDELSSVYRYVLQANDRELTSLAMEMKFINSYYHLLKTRYGQGISLKVSINPAYEDHLLPPLTLQLLIENAVKHNIVAQNTPLTIQIFTNNTGALVVRNNLQRKGANRLTSTKKGLQNINMKYKLLNQSPLDIHESDISFDVIVPLIPATAQIAF